jgi:hypothetical protein
LVAFWSADGFCFSHSLSLSHRIPSARYGADPHQRTTTPADGLPEGVRFGAAPMFGMGNPPTLPWAWGWTWMDMWVLRPVWLPPFPQP